VIPAVRNGVRDPSKRHHLTFAESISSFRLERPRETATSPPSIPSPPPLAPCSSDSVPRCAHKSTSKSPSSSKPQLKCSLGLPPPPPLRPTPILVAPPPRAPAYVRSSRWRAPTTPAQRPPGRSPSSAPGSGERALFPSPSLGCERVLVRVCAFEAFDEMVVAWWGALCLCAAGSRRPTGSGRAA